MITITNQTRDRILSCLHEAWSATCCGGREAVARCVHDLGGECLWCDGTGRVYESGCGAYTDDPDHEGGTEPCPVCTPAPADDPAGVTQDHRTLDRSPNAWTAAHTRAEGFPHLADRMEALDRR